MSNAGHSRQPQLAALSHIAHVPAGLNGGQALARTRRPGEAMSGKARTRAALTARGASPASHRGRQCARLARRDDREYREYLREEQRSQARGPQCGSRIGVEKGCSAGRMQPDLHHGLLSEGPVGPFGRWLHVLRPGRLERVSAVGTDQKPGGNGQVGHVCVRSRTRRAARGVVRHGPHFGQPLECSPCRRSGPVPKGTSAPPRAAGPHMAHLYPPPEKWLLSHVSLS
jgi:hypothetical protein